jgi:hypothetical protein
LESSLLNCGTACPSTISINLCSRSPCEQRDIECLHQPGSGPQSTRDAVVHEAQAPCGGSIYNCRDAEHKRKTNIRSSSNIMSTREEDHASLVPHTRG